MATRVCPWKDGKRPRANGSDGAAAGKRPRANGSDGAAGAAGAAPPLIELAGEVPTRLGEPLWDFGVKADLAPCTEDGLEQPAPAVELQRARLVSELRRSYAKACHEVMGFRAPPADSIDRWLLEQLAQPRQGRGCDPLLPKPGIGRTSCVLLRELAAEVPLRCPTRALGAVALDALRRYHQNAMRWFDRLESTAQLAPTVEALGRWIKEHAREAQGRRRASDCPFRQKLLELSAEGGLSSLFRSEVEPLALRVVEAVSVEAERLVSELGHGAAPATGLQQGGVQLEDASDAFANLRFDGDCIRVSALHMRKIRELYELHQPRPRDRPADVDALAEWDKAFLSRAYVMLRRYITFLGLDPAESGLRGGNMHAAAPEPVFAWLKTEFGVRCELFASPLNCYFGTFFSAFPDVDAPFGSLGSFFDATLTQGSYEVGPPYTEEVMELMARRLLEWLRASSSPLSFVVFVPDWEGCGALNLMDGVLFDSYRRSKHGRKFVLARGKDHHYVTGTQFLADAGADCTRRYYTVPHNTRVYILQNDAGAARWHLTAERERALLERLRPPAQ